jgi:copper homeostasis protein
VPKKIEFELCAETLTACAAALPGGASRIELCRCLEVGGLTPEPSLIRDAVEQSGVPVYVLLRPSAEHFRYTEAIFDAIVDSMHIARKLGAAGFVLGFVHGDDTVDVEHTRKLVEMASPLPVTFHRAFDATPDLPAALEAVVATGCQRILTSGGAPNVAAGAACLGILHQRAGNRIQIMAGGGLRAENAREVAAVSGLKHFHSSLGERQLGADTGAMPPLWIRIQQLIRALSGTGSDVTQRVKPASQTGRDAAPAEEAFEVRN